MKKRVLSLLLALVMVLSVFPMTVFADDGEGTETELTEPVEETEAVEEEEEIPEEPAEETEPEEEPEEELPTEEEPEEEEEITESVSRRNAETTFVTIEHSDGSTTDYSSTYGYSNSNNAAAADAINAAFAGDTVHIIASVYLMQDATLASGVTLVIDSGKTLTISGSVNLDVKDGATLTKDGTLKNEAQVDYDGGFVYSGGVKGAFRYAYNYEGTDTLTVTLDGAANNGNSQFNNTTEGFGFDFSNKDVNVVINAGKVFYLTGGTISFKKGAITGEGKAVTSSSTSSDGISLLESGDTITYAYKPDLLNETMKSGDTLTIQRSVSTNGALDIPTGVTLNLESGATLSIGGNVSTATIEVDSDKIAGAGKISAEGLITKDGRSIYYKTFQNAYDALATDGGTMTVTKSGTSLPAVTEFSGNKYLEIAAGASVTLGSTNKKLTIADGHLSGDGTITANFKIAKTGATTYYATFAQALQEAQSGDTIELMASSISISADTALPEGVTINLPSGKYLYLTNNSGHIVIPNSQITGDGYMKAYAVIDKGDSKEYFGKVETAVTAANAITATPVTLTLFPGYNGASVNVTLTDNVTVNDNVTVQIPTGATLRPKQTNGYYFKVNGTLQNGGTISGIEVKNATTGASAYYYNIAAALENATSGDSIVWNKATSSQNDNFTLKDGVSITVISTSTSYKYKGMVSPAGGAQGVMLSYETSVSTGSGVNKKTTITQKFAFLDTLAAAKAMIAESGATGAAITLFKDVELTEVDETLGNLTGGFTLDLNGHKVDMKEAGMIVKKATGDMLIKDSAGGGSFVNPKTGGSFFEIQNGTLSFDKSSKVFTLDGGDEGDANCAVRLCELEGTSKYADAFNFNAGIITGKYKLAGICLDAGWGDMKVDHYNVGAANKEKGPAVVVTSCPAIVNKAVSDYACFDNLWLETTGEYSVDNYGWFSIEDGYLSKPVRNMSAEAYTKYDTGTTVVGSIINDGTGIYEIAGGNFDEVKVTKGARYAIVNTKTGESQALTFGAFTAKGSETTKSNVLISAHQGTGLCYVYFNGLVTADNANMEILHADLKGGLKVMAGSTVNIYGGDSTTGALTVENGGVLNVYGGNYGTVSVADGGTLKVYGGTFASDVTTYLQGGRGLLDLGEGRYGVKVASVNGSFYSTLEEAITAAGANQEVDLLCDTWVTHGITINKDGLTVDLNGHTVQAEGDIVVFTIVGGFNSTDAIGASLKNGTIRGVTEHASLDGNSTTSNSYGLVKIGGMNQYVSSVSLTDLNIYGTNGYLAIDDSYGVDMYEADGDGGDALQIERGEITIENCTIQGGAGDGAGHGIDMNLQGNGTTYIKNSTISGGEATKGNSASNGINFSSAVSDYTLTIEDSTIAGGCNQPSSGDSIDGTAISLREKSVSSNYIIPSIVLKGTVTLKAPDNGTGFKYSIDDNGYKTVEAANYTVGATNAMSAIINMKNASHVTDPVIIAEGTLNIENGVLHKINVKVPDTKTLTVNVSEDAILGGVDFRVNTANSTKVIINGKSETRENPNIPEGSYVVSAGYGDLTQQAKINGVQILLPPATAKIGDVTYTYIKDAFEAVTGTKTIELLKSCKIVNNYDAVLAEGQTLNIPEGMTLTVESGTLTVNGTVTGDGELIATAKIVKETGTVYYGSLGAALDAAEDGETIVLLDDYSVTGSATSVLCNYTNANNVTLDLNGKTLTDGTGYGFYVSNNNGGSLTIKNGTVINTQGAFINPGKNAKVILEDLIVTNEETERTLIEFDYPNASNDSSVEIKSGKYAGFSTNSTLKDMTVITGGLFTDKPDQLHIATGSEAASYNDATYKWQVRLSKQVEVAEAVVEDDKVKIDGEEINVTIPDEGVTQQEAAEMITKTLDNENVSDFTGTGVNENTENGTIREELKKDTQISGDNTAKGNVDTETTINKKITVDLTAAEIETIADIQQEETTITTIDSMTFDVKPIATMTIKNQYGVETVVKAVIPNEAITAPLTFRLPVEKNVQTTSAAVYHRSALGGQRTYVGTFDIQEENGKKFIELSASEFSYYTYEMINEVNLNTVAVITDGNGSYRGFESLDAAITAFGETGKENDKTLILMKDVEGSKSENVYTPFDFSDKAIELDLNGHILKGSVENAATVTVTNMDDEHQNTLAAVGTYANDVSAFAADGYDTKTTDNENDTLFLPTNEDYRVIVEAEPSGETVDRDLTTGKQSKWKVEGNETPFDTKAAALEAAGEGNEDKVQKIAWLDLYAKDKIKVTVRVEGARFAAAYVTLTFDPENFNVSAPKSGWESVKNSSGTVIGYRFYDYYQGDAGYFENGEVLGTFTFTVKEGEREKLNELIKVSASDTYVAKAWKDGWESDPAAQLGAGQLLDESVNIRLKTMAASVTPNAGLVYKEINQKLLADGYTATDTISGAAITDATIQYAVMTKEEANGVLYTGAEGEAQSTTVPGYVQGKEPKEPVYGNSMTAIAAGDYVVFWKISKLGYVNVTGKENVSIAPLDVQLQWIMPKDQTENGTGLINVTAVGDTDGLGQPITADFWGRFTQDGFDYSDTENMNLEAGTTEPSYPDKNMHAYVKALNKFRTPSITMTERPETAAADELKAVGTYKFKADLGPNYHILNAEIEVLIDGAKIEGYELENINDVYFDGQPHAAGVLNATGADPVDATVMYRYSQDNGETWTAWQEEIPSFTEANAVPYKIQMQLSADNYYTVVKNYEFNVKTVIYYAEKNDYVTGWDLVLVFTDEEVPSFTYDGKTMYDVTAFNYKLGSAWSDESGKTQTVAGTAYKHVYGIVVEGNADVGLVLPNNNELSSDMKVLLSGKGRMDVNKSGTIDINDLVAVAAVYNVDKSYLTSIDKEVIAIVLRADVNGNKTVNTYDCSLIKSNTGK